MSFNVIDFGADPTGASNTSAAIQAAINAASPTNGVVFFPAGTYLVGTTLTASGTLRMIGSGRGTVIAGTANPLLSISYTTAVSGAALSGPRVEELLFRVTSSNAALTCTASGYAPATNSSPPVFRDVLFDASQSANASVYLSTFTYGGNHIFDGCYWLGYSTAVSASTHVSGTLLQGVSSPQFTNCYWLFLNAAVSSTPFSGNISQSVTMTNCVVQGSVIGISDNGSSGNNYSNILSDNSFQPLVLTSCSDATVSGGYFGSSLPANNGGANMTINGNSNRVKIIAAEVENYNSGNVGVSLGKGGGNVDQLMMYGVTMGAPSYLHHFDIGDLRESTISADFGGSSSGSPINYPTFNPSVTGAVAFRNCPRLTPAGVQTAPTVPGSAVPLVNPFFFDCTVAVTTGNLGGCVIALNGVTYTTIPLGQVATIPVLAGQTITLVYGQTPTWAWFAQ
jgi:hypothetical protein